MRLCLCMQACDGSMRAFEYVPVLSPADYVVAASRLDWIHNVALH